MKHVAALLSVIIFFAFLGCAKQGEEKKGPYLAKVGSAKITQADFEREMKNLPPFAQKLFEGKGGKEKFLDELIKKELLYQEALKKGLDKDAEFKEKVEDFKKISLISQVLEKEIETKVTVTEQDVKDYYEKHKNELAAISQIRAKHILVKTEAEAKKILESIKKGEDFGKLAQKYSIDKGSAKNGGDLGFFSAGQMVPEFEAAAAQLDIGKVSEPVKTKFGYHIIKVVDKKTGKPLEFEKIQNNIFQRLTAEKQKEVFDTFIENLRKSYKVEINQDAVSKLSMEVEKEEGTGEQPEKPGESKEKQQEESKKKKD